MPGNSSHAASWTDCFLYGWSSLFYLSYTAACLLLLLPLCAFVLLHGWRRRRSSSSSSPPVSHADCFTYHLVAMEMVAVAGGVLEVCGVVGGVASVFVLGYRLVFFTWSGELLFHALTCAERHLAAARPLAYCRLKGERGVRLRNAIAGAAWPLSGAAALMMSAPSLGLFALTFSFALVFVGFVCFLSVSVLCVLIRRGPGERGGASERAERSKRRAFRIILSALAVLTLRFAASVSYTALAGFSRRQSCGVRVAPLCFNLPSRLLLPLLYLLRAK